MELCNEVKTGSFEKENKAGLLFNCSSYLCQLVVITFTLFWFFLIIRMLFVIRMEIKHKYSLSLNNCLDFVQVEIQFYSNGIPALGDMTAGWSCFVGCVTVQLLVLKLLVIRRWIRGRFKLQLSIPQFPERSRKRDLYPCRIGRALLKASVKLFWSSYYILSLGPPHLV